MEIIKRKIGKYFGVDLLYECEKIWKEIIISDVSSTEEALEFRNKTKLFLDYWAEFIKSKSNFKEVSDLELPITEKEFYEKWMMLDSKALFFIEGQKDVPFLDEEKIHFFDDYICFLSYWEKISSAYDSLRNSSKNVDSGFTSFENSHLPNYFYGVLSRYSIENSFFNNFTSDRTFLEKFNKKISRPDNFLKLSRKLAEFDKVKLKRPICPLSETNKNFWSIFPLSLAKSIDMQKEINAIYEGSGYYNKEKPNFSLVGFLEQRSLIKMVKQEKVSNQDDFSLEIENEKKERNKKMRF